MTCMHTKEPSLEKEIVENYDIAYGGCDVIVATLHAESNILPGSSRSIELAINLSEEVNVDVLKEELIELGMESYVDKAVDSEFKAMTMEQLIAYARTNVDIEDIQYSFVMYRARELGIRDWQISQEIKKVKLH